ncbi:MAG: tetratricopeptide repeat protein [Bryobacterales bacterium]|nr:tetratricopeptide repeat protein [Bryobacterales bacterium]MBV9400163.1 tetratricopeptide repeat protein [Bryobacterales bacterium]
MKLSLLVLIALPLAAQTADPARCMNLRKHGDPGENACWQVLSRSSDPLTRGQGLFGLKDYKGADSAFEAAEKARPKDANIKVWEGDLYFAHWQAPEAANFYNAALEIDKKNARALLGLAQIAADQYEGKAVEFANKALDADPKLYEARELTARIALEDNNESKAVEEANKAVAISPEALDAMAILATVDWLDDKPAPAPAGQIETHSPWMDKIFKVNPHYGEAYSLAGHFFVINRRYIEGIAYYRKALELDPNLQSARSELGINLMRLGQNEEAYKLLVDAWTAGWQDLPTKNTLVLMDSYKNFDDVKTTSGRGIVKVNKKEEALVKPYVADELDKIVETYDKKYKYKLPGTVQVEVYPDHDDFAVRTMGMPGLGALGVTFGNIVAMDSPDSNSAERPAGSSNWASTLWHEMSHVYVLSMTGHRVPRWFTEGLAVYEETATNKDWGDRLDPPSIMAIKDHKLLPVAELDRGYIHPSYPNQVIVSYFQGGRIITYIVEKWGYDTVLAMIKDFGDRMSTPEVIEKELKMKPEEFDKQFLPWLEAQTKTQVENYESWSKQVKTLNNDVKTKDWAAVIKTGTAIRDLYRDYVEPGSVYEALAKAYEAQGDKAKARDELKRYSDVGGRNPETLKHLADLQAEAGDKRAAAQTLGRLNYIYLRDDQAHQKLGNLYLDLNNAGGAVREFQAVLAGKPVDLAGAHFQLAKAYQAAKRTAEATEEVYAALELAPEYKPAQKLLLELNAKDTNVK